MNLARREDITIEKVVEEYKKFPNMYVVAEKLGCSETVIHNRLHKAGIDTSIKREYRRDLRAEKYTRRKIFDTKQEQAHYICTELGGELAELLLSIKERSN